LWLVVFLRLATPWIPVGPWSLYQYVPDLIQPNTLLHSASSDDRRDLLRRAPEPRARGGIQPEPDLAAQAAENVAEKDGVMHARSGRSSDWFSTSLLLAWLCGAIVLAARRLWLRRRLVRWRSSWLAATDPSLRALFARCCDEVRLPSTIALQIADRDVGPATWGICATGVVLPSRLTKTLSSEELRLVLLHELLHVRRRDVLIDAIASTIACLHWFNPAAWLALAGLRRERESACDAALLEVVGSAARRDYGALLLKAVELLPPVGSPAAVSMFGQPYDSGPLERRIQMIASYRGMTSSARIVGGTILVGFVLVGLTDAGPPNSRPTKIPEKNPPVAAADGIEQEEIPVPVLAERAAAQKILDLGGRYKLDGDRHVVEVNMWHHYDMSGERHENLQITDEGLLHIDQFPRLKRLFLKETQVSDNGLQHVGRLRELEELLMPDAESVTDEGVAHLRKLPKLRILCLGGSAITDEAIAHLSEVRSLEELLLDSNNFTDKALLYVRRLPKLKSVDFGDYGRPGTTTDFSAEGMRHLREMPALEELSLRYMEKTDRGLKQLYGLKSLRLLRLYDYFCDIGDLQIVAVRLEAAVAGLQKACPDLKVETYDRVYPSLNTISGAADPKRQQANRRDGAEGLKIIERFLALMWNKEDARAEALADEDIVAEFRRLRRSPAFEPLKVSSAYGNSEMVIAVSSPAITYDLFEIDGEERRIIGKRTAHVVLKAVRKVGTWRVTDSHYQDPDSDEVVERFLSKFPGSVELEPGR
jgi:beta-lactamase regulating signal transducer with metallopeptidase domain